jgi:hypothetical protein
MTDFDTVYSDRIDTGVSVHRRIEPLELDDPDTAATWDEVAGAVAAKLLRHELAVIPALDEPGDGGRVLLLVPDGQRRPLCVYLSPSACMALVNRLASAAECTVRHLED